MLWQRNDPKKKTLRELEPADYYYSSAKFYETGIDDPMAIASGFFKTYRRGN
jgi:hypothetical protein